MDDKQFYGYIEKAMSIIAEAEKTACELGVCVDILIKDMQEASDKGFMLHKIAA